jgi:acyl carrier protein
VTDHRRRRSHGAAGRDVSLEAQVCQVMAASFDLDDDDLPVPMSRDTIPEWTSRSHMMLVLNLEAHFEVTFSLEQMVDMTSAAAIAEVLIRIGAPIQEG